MTFSSPRATPAPPLTPPTLSNVISPDISWVSRFKSSDSKKPAEFNQHICVYIYAPPFLTPYLEEALPQTFNLEELFAEFEHVEPVATDETPPEIGHRDFQIL